jgi:hypothetical protein
MNQPSINIRHELSFLTPDERSWEIAQEILDRLEAAIRAETLAEVRAFLKDSNVFDRDYIYTRKVRMLEAFDEAYAEVTNTDI